MNVFELNCTFETFESLLEAKKSYEIVSNTVLVIDKCHRLRKEDNLQKVIVYDRLTFVCKAGKERPTESKGYRNSSTLKKNCPVKVKHICIVPLPVFCIAFKFGEENE